MYRNHAIGVVVPAYNEEGLVGEVLETMPSFVDAVYVVDDCSTDGTWEEIVRCADRLNDRQTTSVPLSGGDSSSAHERDDAVADGGGSAVVNDTEGVGTSRSSSASRPDVLDSTGPTIVPIQHADNRGVGGAIKTGYERALEDGMDVTAVMAGDAQMDPEQLDRLVDPIVDGRVAYAKGNRLAGRDYHESMSTWRLFGNSTLTFLTKVASGYWGMMDPQNGYTAISSEALESVDLDGIYEEYGFANDLLVELNTHGYRIADVTMPAVYGDEQSHIEYRTFVPRLSNLLLRGFVRRLGRRYVLREFHPLVFFYGLGVGGLAISVAALARVAAERSSGDDANAGSRLSATVLYAFLGTFSLIFAMAYDRDRNEDSVVTVQ